MALSVFRDGAMSKNTRAMVCTHKVWSTLLLTCASFAMKTTDYNDFQTPGLGCTTRSQTEPPPRLHAPAGCQTGDHGTYKLKLSLSQKVGLHAKNCHPIWDVSQCFWAELHEAGGLSVTLAVNRLLFVSLLNV